MINFCGESPTEISLHGALEAMSTSTRTVRAPPSPFHARELIEVVFVTLSLKKFDHTQDVPGVHGSLTIVSQNSYTRSREHRALDGVVTVL